MMSIKDILKSVYDAVEGICERTFIQDRPKSVIDSLNDYMVVKAVSSFNNREVDEKGSYDYYESTVQIEIYVKDRVSASNPNQINILSIDDKVTQVLSLFPIKDRHIHAMRPRVTLSISDGNGFHCTIIQARLTTLV